jgi:hypothetical protein
MIKILKIMILIASLRFINAINLKDFNFSSAGVIPRVKIDNKYYLLLGKETQGVKAGSFDSFCGKKENKETSWQTASREFYEESVGALGELEYYQKLKSSVKAKIILLRAHKGACIDYIVDLNHKQLAQFVENFYKNINKPNLAPEFKEKSQLALFEENQLCQIIKKNRHYQNIKVNAMILDPASKPYYSFEQIYSTLAKMLKWRLK